MRKTFMRVALFLSAFVLIAFVVFLVNQTAQVVELASRVSPAFGEATFWALIFLYVACLAVPAFILLRLPRALVPPESEDSPEFEEHLERLSRRISGNALLAGRSVGSREELEEALAVLDERADEIAKTTASQVFVTTAVSQNGSLDAVAVLAAQSRMVLQIARTYYQRPTLRELIYLYANVATTSFIASEIDDIDLAEQMQPVISAVVGSTGGAVPGLQSVSSLVVNSITTGSANAFLVLRTGVIAKGYCRALVAQPKRTLRRSGTAEAAQMLGAIALSGTRRLSTAAVKGSGRAAGSVVSGMSASIRDAGGAVWRKMRWGGSEESEEPGRSHGPA